MININEHTYNISEVSGKRDQRDPLPQQQLLNVFQLRLENSSPRQAKRNGKRPYMHRSSASQLAVGWLVTSSFSLGLSSATENLNG
ncbi:hypothetical protein T01_8466 [Trichinella spiralis]|uniref:Uncharacterized protein n=1 Tax=Trichinella spiralis TaxID=6334 RepID=A0A0V1BB63_TRISP|nr:hypothetical protein T01_8466 [Trichinella spiralis]